MQNLLNDLIQLLSQNEKYVSNGKLLKNVIVKDALKLEPSLLKLLLTDPSLKKRFLIEVLNKNMLYVPYTEIDDVDYQYPMQTKS